MNLSAMVLTHNEDWLLERMLKSIADYVDEIVVIDDMSTNPRTLEICRKYGAKIIREPLNGDFSKQRNLAMQESRGDWILKADPDEVFPEETMKQIQALCSGLEEEVACVSFLLYQVIYGKKLGTAGVEHTRRLFRRGRVRFVGTVHPKFEIDGQERFFPLPILHYPLQSIRQFIEKLNLYTDLLLKRDYFAEYSLSKLKKELLFFPLKIFWKNYIKKKGYRDGIEGLLWIFLSDILNREMLLLKEIEQRLKKGSQE